MIEVMAVPPNLPVRIYYSVGELDRLLLGERTLHQRDSPPCFHVPSDWLVQEERHPAKVARLAVETLAVWWVSTSE